MRAAAKEDCDRAKADDDQNKDHLDTTRANAELAGALPELIGRIGDTLKDIDGKFGESNEHEYNETPQLRADVDNVVSHLDDTSKWNGDALDCKKPPATDPAPPAKPAPTPPAPPTT
jgi:hypothetical protein